MAVTVAAATCVGLLADGGLPGQVVVEILAFLAVAALGVMGTLALAMHHVLLVGHAVEGQAARGVTVARARATYHHVLDGIVVLLANLRPVVEKFVAKSVQAGEVDAEVGHFQEVLDFLGVGVFYLHVARKDSVRIVSVRKFIEYCWFGGFMATSYEGSCKERAD